MATASVDSNNPHSYYQSNKGQTSCTYCGVGKVTSVRNKPENSTCPVGT